MPAAKTVSEFVADSTCFCIMRIEGEVVMAYYSGSTLLSTYYMSSWVEDASGVDAHIAKYSTSDANEYIDIDGTLYVRAASIA